MSTNPNPEASGTLFGHPCGLFTLFFAEMWERFSYYGMRALLLFYMLKGFLEYVDKDAYAIYGAYTALVYMTPFFGGMIADRLLGARRAVILGGLLMAAGHLMMTIEEAWAFYSALALLIAGNGFFKPNISTIVGSLYPQGSPKRDGGFTIFYMGINLGAAMSPLLCGFIGETYGWHYGFGLATIGMVTGVAIFVAPSVVAQLAMFGVAVLSALNVFLVPILGIDAGDGKEIQLYGNITILALLVLAGLIAFWELRQGREDSLLSSMLARIIIMTGAVGAALGLFIFRPANFFSIGVNMLVGMSLLVAGIVAWFALGRGGLPKDVGAPPDPDQLQRPFLGPISREWLVYAGSLLSIPIFSFLVSENRRSLFPEETIAQMKNSGGQFLSVFIEEISKPAGIILMLCGIGAFVYLLAAALRQPKVARERMYVVLILTFFSMLFWAFFEQAGSSLNNFTDRNVDRVFEARRLTEEDVGTTIKFRIPAETTDKELEALPMLSQEQLGYHYGNDAINKIIAQAIRRKQQEKLHEATSKEDKEKIQKETEELIQSVTKDNVLTISGLTYLRDVVNKESQAGTDTKDPLPKTVDWLVTKDNVGMAIGGSEMPASVFQSVNPIYIILLGIVFSALWSFLGNRGLEPSTPVKFALGLLQLGLGFGAVWYGAKLADDRGMVALSWLFLGYLLMTTGELCLSPVGLSMVTKLSPAFLVSTVMGMWFLATAFSQFLAAIIAQFTRVGGHGSEGGSGAIPIPNETVRIYGDVFGQIAITAIGSALICFLLAPLLRRWMHEDVMHDEEETGESPMLAGSESSTAITEKPGSP
ncbi:MAG: hypothetical protein KatS3mg105_1258 [Gemmatales bacterium]|nr:MAG: hypothetical protein KatS3mg105_1258 [Gemmatales bacterium]